MSTLRSLIHENFPQSCFSADDLDEVYSVLSDTDFLFPTISTTSPIQDRLASYYTIGGVLLTLPSPVAKRTDHTMRWAESIRLPKRTRETRERFNELFDICEVTSSKREDLLLDVLPFWRKIDRNLSLKVRRNIQLLCDFPLRGKMIIDEPELPEGEEEKEVVKSHTGGWLIEDDIED
jgi:hypothetical protein